MKEWWTAREIAKAGFRGVPVKLSAVEEIATRENWRDPEFEYPANEDHGFWRQRRRGRNQIVQYHWRIIAFTPSRWDKQLRSVLGLTAVRDSKARIAADVTRGIRSTRGLVIVGKGRK